MSNRNKRLKIVIKFSYCIVKLNLRCEYYMNWFTIKVHIKCFVGTLCIYTLRLPNKIIEEMGI